jgi:hypothetical protein
VQTQLIEAIEGRLEELQLESSSLKVLGNHWFRTGEATVVVDAGQADLLRPHLLERDEIWLSRGEGSSLGANETLAGIDIPRNQLHR